MLLAVASRTRQGPGWVEGDAILQGRWDVGGRAKSGATDVGRVDQIGEGKDSS